MHSAINRNSELSSKQLTNRVPGTFSPAEHDTHGQHGNSAQTHHNEERLLNAREVADKLGVSERFIRDHTTRRSPRIPAVKLGKLIRNRCADVDFFMAELGTLTTSNRSRFGV